MPVATATNAVPRPTAHSKQPILYYSFVDVLWRFVHGVGVTRSWREAESAACTLTALCSRIGIKAVREILRIQRVALAGRRARAPTYRSDAVHAPTQTTDDRQTRTGRYQSAASLHLTTPPTADEYINCSPAAAAAAVDVRVAAAGARCSGRSRSRTRRR